MAVQRLLPGKKYYDRTSIRTYEENTGKNKIIGAYIKPMENADDKKEHNAPIEREWTPGADYFERINGEFMAQADFNSRASNDSKIEPLDHHGEPGFTDYDDTVTFIYLDDKLIETTKKGTYTLVARETTPKELLTHKSINSNVGRALYGKKIGDIVEWNAPQSSTNKTLELGPRKIKAKVKEFKQGYKRG